MKMKINWSMGAMWVVVAIGGGSTPIFAPFVPAMILSFLFGVAVAAAYFIASTNQWRIKCAFYRCKAHLVRVWSGLINFNE